MHILSILLSGLALLIAIGVIRQTIVAHLDRILDALAGVSPSQGGREAVIITFRAQQPIVAGTPACDRLAA